MGAPMSDPANSGYTCCDVPMVAMVTAELELALGGLEQPCAWGCLQCGKWRHAFPPGHSLRPLVVQSMNDWSDRQYRERLAKS